MSKLLLLILKSGAGAKLVTSLGAVTFAVAAIVTALETLPVSDPWCDATVLILLLTTVGAIVSGAPEPDIMQKVVRGEMKWAEFFYLWFYRSSHLFISAATAYMLHPNKWREISDSPGSNGAK